MSLKRNAQKSIKGPRVADQAAVAGDPVVAEAAPREEADFPVTGLRGGQAERLQALAVARAEKVLGTWRYECSLTAEELGNCDTRMTLTSMLGDLAVFCRVRGISFEEAVKTAVEAVAREERESRGKE